MPRTDILIGDVVQRWLFEGESMLSIATSYDVEQGSINKRIAQARLMWPGLPWSERKPSKRIGPTEEWRRMMDGKKGERETAGSIVQGRRHRKR